MISNVALDVFIGLVFVYLIYSLLATIMQEIIASFLNLRAVVLVKAIRIMLNDRKPFNLQSKNAFGQMLERIAHSLKMQWHFITCRLPDFTLAKAFYKHPSIKYLSPNVSRSKPSYIEPKNFSSTLIQVLRGRNFDGSLSTMSSIYNTLFPMVTAGQQNANLTTVEVGSVNPVIAVIEPETLDKLRQVYIDSGKEITAFTNLLEDWYNETMDRATGWYKRQTRRILFFLGLTIAIWGNVDSIKIYHVLAKDKTARDQMVQLAIQSQQKYSAAVSQLKDTTRKNNGAIMETSGALKPTTGDSILDSAYSQVTNDIDQSNHVLAMGWHTSPKYTIYHSLLLLRDSLTNNLKTHKEDTALSSRIKAIDSQAKALEPEVYDKFDWSSSPLGWVVTALALTLGAPFWFDLLTKFMSLRAAGPKPVVNIDDDDQPTPSPSVPSASPLSDQVVPQMDTTIIVNNQPEVVRDESADANIAQG